MAQPARRDATGVPWVTAPSVTYLTVAGISGNTRAWMTPDGWDVLGYAPQDDAEVYVAAVEHLHGPEDTIRERTQGGVFTEPAYVGLAKEVPKETVGEAKGQARLSLRLFRAP